MSVELYRKHRPTTFKEVVGQRDAVSKLVEMGKRKEIPHCLLFTGPSGCGKTTLARILVAKLKCNEDFDFFEVNGAESRGIDSIRDINRNMNKSTIGGGPRIWLIDECHALTSDAQTAFLKMLEDTPTHVYFFLATTDPQKLKRTIITRATEIRCSAVADGELSKLVERVASLEDVEMNEAVIQRIIEVSEGSARKALVILHAVFRLPDTESQLAGIESSDTRGPAIDIARGLIGSKPWKMMAPLVKAVDANEAESVRWMVLGYCKSIVLSGGPKAGRSREVMEHFRDNYFDTKANGLVISCFDASK